MLRRRRQHSTTSKRTPWRWGDPRKHPETAALNPSIIHSLDTRPAPLRYPQAYWVSGREFCRLQARLRAKPSSVHWPQSAHFGPELTPHRHKPSSLKGKYLTRNPTHCSKKAPYDSHDTLWNPVGLYKTSYNLAKPHESRSRLYESLMTRSRGPINPYRRPMGSKALQLHPKP